MKASRTRILSSLAIISSSMSSSIFIPLCKQVINKSSLVEKYLYISPILIPHFFAITLILAFSYPFDENSSIPVSRINSCRSSLALSKASLYLFSNIFMNFVVLHKFTCITLCKLYKSPSQILFYTMYIIIYVYYLQLNN